MQWIRWPTDQTTHFEDCVMVMIHCPSHARSPKLAVKSSARQRIQHDLVIQNKALVMEEEGKKSRLYHEFAAQAFGSAAPAAGQQLPTNNIGQDEADENQLTN